MEGNWLRELHFNEHGANQDGEVSINGTTSNEQTYRELELFETF